MRRVSSVPTRAPSPLYTPSSPASRQPLRTSLGSPYGSPIVSEPRPLPSLFPGTTLPPASSHAPDPVHSSYLGRHGNGTGSESGSPTLLRAGMTAQPQQYGTLGKHDTRAYDNTHSSFGTRAYDIFERMVLSRPDSLTGELHTNCPIIIMDRSFSMTFHRFRVSKIDFFVKWINILWCYKRFWKFFWTFYSSNIVSWFPQKYWATRSFSIVIIIKKKKVYWAPNQHIRMIS